VDEWIGKGGGGGGRSGGEGGGNIWHGVSGGGLGFSFVFGH
jgi:hypothetical protein